MVRAGKFRRPRLRRLPLQKNYRGRRGIRFRRAPLNAGRRGGRRAFFPPAESAENAVRYRHPRACGMVEEVLFRKQGFPSAGREKPRAAPRTRRIFPRLLFPQKLPAHDPSGRLARGRRRPAPLERGLPSRFEFTVFLRFGVQVQPPRTRGMLYRFSAFAPPRRQKIRKGFLRRGRLYPARRDGYRGQPHGGLGAVFAQPRQSSLELPRPR